MAELESKVEKDFVKIAMLDYSSIAFKFKREAIKGGADRLIFTPSGHSFFIEFKRPGGSGVISPHQLEFRSMMKEFNERVYFVDSLKAALNILKLEIEVYG